MALSANENPMRGRALQNQTLGNFPVAESVHIYAGALVAITSDGHLVPVGHADADQFIGVAGDEVETSAGEGGDKRCEVSWGHQYPLPAGAITNASAGLPVGASDDNTLNLDVESNMQIGELVEVDGEAWVAIRKQALVVVPSA